MEAWVGQWWHRVVNRLADTRELTAEVKLQEMELTLRLMFHAGGGDHAVRIAPSSSVRHQGPRQWLQKLAGTGQQLALPRIDPEVLALPSTLAVFPSKELNRNLYLWLAAMGSVFVATGDWLFDNQVATHRALEKFPGLRSRYKQLLATHLEMRPQVAGLKGNASTLETHVRTALSMPFAPHRANVGQLQVAPVWLWLGESESVIDRVALARGCDIPQGRIQKLIESTQRRQARTELEDKPHAPRLLSAKTESIQTWSEFFKMNNADSNENDEDDAQAVANDLDVLSLTEGQKTTTASIKFDLDLPSASADDVSLGEGAPTPEWDWRRGKLMPERCSIQYFLPIEMDSFEVPPSLRATAKRVRRRMEMLRVAPQWQSQQIEGDELDVDAWVRFSGDASNHTARSCLPPIYKRQARLGRSLATLLLADLSLSTDAYALNNARVIDVIRDALFVFGEAIAGMGDAFEMRGFSSVRRDNVRIHALKTFEEPWGDKVVRRIGAIRPGYYTRMGAAIRDATRQLRQRSERQKLLLILTDGKPNDIDYYEGRYGLEDTRHAVQEARTEGLVPFCVTIDRDANDYMPMLFGAQGFALVKNPQDLVARLTQAWIQLAQ